MPENEMKPCPVSDIVLNEILKKVGEWCEPYTAPRESGVAVDGDISQADADRINADSRERYRGILAIALPALSAWNARAPAQSAGDGEMYAALLAVNKIIAEAALTGFNYKDGDWADRLFHSQQATSAALKSARAIITDTAREGATDADLVERIEAAICKAEGWDREHYDANPGAKAAAVIAHAEYERGWKEAVEACVERVQNARAREGTTGPYGAISLMRNDLEVAIRALPLPTATSNVGTGEGA